MEFAFIALLPVFLTILLGALVGKTGLIRPEHWLGVDQLAFYVLFPAIIAKSMITADFGDLPVFKMAAVMVCGMVSMQVLLFVLKKPTQAILGVDNPAWTSVFQGAGRWHTFLGLAIMPALFGDPGLALAAVAAASITPISNTASIIVMSIYTNGSKPSVVSIAKTLATNPFILAIAIGLGIKASGIVIPQSVIGVLDLTGNGALGIALLSVGAALRFGKIRGAIKPITAAVVLKMAVVPLFMAFYCMVFDVTGLPRTVAILAGSIPTAAVSYIFARKMGGDSELMANIITIQIIVAAFTIPLVLSILN